MFARPQVHTATLPSRDVIKSGQEHDSHWTLSGLATRYDLWAPLGYLSARRSTTTPPRYSCARAIVSFAIPDGCSPMGSANSSSSGSGSISEVVTPCSGRGKCETSTAGQHCACQIGFTGRYCEHSKSDGTRHGAGAQLTPCWWGALRPAVGTSGIYFRDRWTLSSSGDRVNSHSSFPICC